LRRAFFFWTGSPCVSSVICLRNWKNACKATSQGSVAVKKIRDHNIALLGKWIWKAINDSDLDWVKILRSRIFKRRKLERLDGRPIMGSSTFWKSGNVVRVFKCVVIFNCGNSKNIRLWLDRWIGHISLAATYPSLFELAVYKEAYVYSQYSIIGVRNWNILIVRALMYHLFLVLLILYVQFLSLV